MSKSSPHPSVSTESSQKFTQVAQNVVAKFNKYLDGQRARIKNPEKRKSRILAGVTFAGLSIVGLGIAAAGAYIGNPLLVVGGLYLSASSAAIVAVEIFPEYFCASDARRKLRSELKIDEIKGEAVIDAFGRAFGVGKSATIIKRREADLNNMLISANAPPEAFEPPSLFRRFKNALGYPEEQLLVADKFQSQEFIEKLSKQFLKENQKNASSEKGSNTPTTSTSEEKEDNVFKTNKSSIASKNEQPSTNPRNPSGVTLFTLLNKIKGFFNEKSLSQRQ